MLTAYKKNTGYIVKLYAYRFIKEYRLHRKAICLPFYKRNTVYTVLRHALWFNGYDFKYFFNRFIDIFWKVYGKGFERKGFTKTIYFTCYAWIYLPSWRLTPRHHFLQIEFMDLEWMGFALAYG